MSRSPDIEQPLMKSGGADSLAESEVEAAPGSGSMSARALGLFFFALLTVVAALEKVGLKKATDSMGSFQVFLNQLIVFFFGIVFSGVVLYKLARTNDISPEMRAFPKWKFAAISICDTLAGILILVPLKHVDGDLLTLLLQGVVPATMFFSVILLKKRFHWLHYLGCAIILIGIFLNTYPEMASSAHLVTGSAWYLVPLFISCIPAALSGICQEIALANQDMDIYWYQLWVAFFQFCLAAIVSPFSFLMQSPDMSIKDLPRNVYDGLLCWLPSESLQPAGYNCSDGFSSVLVYIGLCIIFNILISLVVKYGGAVFMMVALTMAVPLQYILFAVKTPYFVPDPNKLSWLNIVGLLVTVVGLVAYHWAKEPDQVEEHGVERDSNAIVRGRIASMSPSMAPFTPRMSSTPRASPAVAAAYVKRRRAELSQQSPMNGATGQSAPTGSLGAHSASGRRALSTSDNRVSHSMREAPF